MRLSGLLLTLALAGWLAPAAAAGDCGCSQGGGCNCAGNCGCNGGCHGGGGCCDPCCDDGCNGARCVLKVGKKKIKVICYGCECDQVCMPCPSDKGCTHCEDLCDGSCCDTGCGCSCDHKPICKFRWTDWCPNGAVAYDRKKLIKYEAEKEVPDYKWEVVKCETHGHGPAPQAAPSEAPPVPPAPKPASFTKRAPAGVRVGQVIPCTDEEIRQIERQMQVRPVSHTAPAAQPASAAQTAPVKAQPRVARIPAPKSRIGTGAARTASQEQLPWGLFGK
jgi:hypothetical protein